MPSIREYFHKLAAKRTAARELNQQFEAIMAAIDDGDVKTVQEITATIIAAKTFFPEQQFSAMVLKALATRNFEITDAVLSCRDKEEDLHRMLSFRSALIPSR